MLLRLVAVLVLLTAAAAGGLYVWLEKAAMTPLEPKDSGTPVEFRVQKGVTLRQVGNQLEEAHLIRSALIWRLYVRLYGGRSPQAGRHPVSPSMNVPEMLEALAATPLSDDVALALIEGWRLRDVDEFLANEKLADPGAYLKAARSPERFKIPFPFKGRDLEGYLLPETYMVPPGKVDVDRLIQRQIDAFDERFYQANLEEIKRSARELRELVIVASMLEREERTPAQRPIIAGIMYRRLDKNVPLGIDATSRYKLADWNDSPHFYRALADPEDEYNTRLRAGLPPGPIGAPSLDALLAALRPVSSPYWYYLHDGQGQVHFARNAAEHENNKTSYNVH